MGWVEQSKTPADLTGFKEWAEESYDIGSLDEHEAIIAYGPVVAVEGTVTDQGSLTEAAFELLEAGFTQLWDDAVAGLRQFGHGDIAALLEEAASEFREGDPYRDPSQADERRRSALDARWDEAGAVAKIDALGERLLADTGWSPPAE